MATKTITTTQQSDGYFTLVKRFPIVRIRDDAHLVAATEMIDQLLQEHLNIGQQSYLDVLTDLVEIYETKHVLIPDADEADILQELMNANRLSQSALAKLVGISQSTISAVLNGTRSLTKRQVELLAQKFKVSPSVFFPR